MSSLKQPAFYVLGIIAVAIVGWVGMATAKSRPAVDERCGVRVKELEAEVISLRKQLQELAGRQSNTTVALGTTKSSRFGGVARRSMKNEASAPCDPPFGYDQQGIKFYRPECLDSTEADSCSVPYVYTSTGIKTYKPNCLDNKGDVPSSCDSPFTFDAHGIKSYKPECL